MTAHWAVTNADELETGSAGNPFKFGDSNTRQAQEHAMHHSLITSGGATASLADAKQLSLLCRRHVADMSPTSPNVAKSWPTLRVVATQKRPRHTQFMSITADKYKSVQTYELATLP
jgi:hypothetical protein